MKMPANIDAKPEVCAVILAAGFSTRFGGNKLIMDLGESPTIGVPTALARAIEKASGKRIRETPIRPEHIL